MSVLTDQVEAQGEKIRDLESSLEEHHHKLISTEEMLQQVRLYAFCNLSGFMFSFKQKSKKYIRKGSFESFTCWFFLPNCEHFVCHLEFEQFVVLQ